MDKTYTMTIELDVSIKSTGLIVQNPDSVTAAIRHTLRQALPTGWRRNGMFLHMGTLHVETKEKEVVNHE